MCSYKVPPNWFVILYLPSENAPAPPNPFMIPQVLQLIHDLILTPSIGHFLLSKGFPDSNNAIFKLGFNFIAS